MMLDPASEWPVLNIPPLIRTNSCIGVPWNTTSSSLQPVLKTSLMGKPLKMVFWPPIICLSISSSVKAPKSSTFVVMPLSKSVGGFIPVDVWSYLDGYSLVMAACSSSFRIVPDLRCFSSFFDSSSDFRSVSCANFRSVSEGLLWPCRDK